MAKKDKAMQLYFRVDDSKQVRKLDVEKHGNVVEFIMERNGKIAEMHQDPDVEVPTLVLTTGAHEIAEDTLKVKFRQLWVSIGTSAFYVRLVKEVTTKPKTVKPDVVLEDNQEH